MRSGGWFRYEIEDTVHRFGAANYCGGRDTYYYGSYDLANPSRERPVDRSEPGSPESNGGDLMTVALSSMVALVVLLGSAVAILALTYLWSCAGRRPIHAEDEWPGYPLADII